MNVQKLMIEIFKVKIGIAPELMKEVFDIVDTPYNLRSGTKFKSHLVKTVTYGLETPSYLGPKLWNLVPDELKKVTTLNEFKNRIKGWIPGSCPCKLCKVYIQHIGYMDMFIKKGQVFKVSVTFYDCVTKLLFLVV